MIRKEFHCEVRKIDGSVDLDDNANPLENKEKSLREFKTCDDVNILIANPASLAESVSLHKVCHHAIYVDRTYVATNWVQSKKRIHRIGMERGIETRYTVLKSVYPHLDDDTEDPRRTIDHDLDDNLERIHIFGREEPFINIVIYGYLLSCVDHYLWSKIILVKDVVVLKCVWSSLNDQIKERSSFELYFCPR